MLIEQLKTPKVARIASSSASDTGISITIFGTVSGYPDFEILVTNGTTEVAGSKTFQSVERIVKNAPTVGRITVFATGSSLAVLPVGDTTAGVLYKKVQIYPLPSTVFDINVQYYKDPYRLVEDGDVHELGQDFDEAIILLSVAKVKAESEIEGATNFFSLYKDELRNLRKQNADKPDWFPTLKGPRSRFGFRFGPHPFLGFGQVGPHFGRRTVR